MDALSTRAIVDINGTKFDSWQGKDVISASVSLTTDKSGEGSIELFDPDFKIIDGFLSGGVKALEAKFWLGWENDLAGPLFTGILARAEWSERITTFRFHDNSAKMKREVKTRYFKKKTDIDILKKLAKDNGLKFSLKATTTGSQPIDSLMQSGQTDWELALKIAGKMGLKLYVKDDTLYAVEAGTTQLSPPSNTLIFEKDFQLLRGFQLTYKLPTDKRGRVNKAEVRGRAKGGKQLKGDKTITGNEAQDIVIHDDLPQQTVAMATRRAGGKVGKRREYAFEHQLKTLPSFKKPLDLRSTLTLAGMGKFFSGNYVVTELMYSFGAGELTAHITAGADLK